MKLTLPSLGDLDTRAEEAQADHDRRYPGDPEERQPVHTVYVAADRFTSATPEELGAEALRLLDEHAPDAAAMPGALGVETTMAEVIRERVAAKLAHDPVEDLRIDFETGYGMRADDAEDGHVADVVEAVARAYEARRLPYYWGLRVKSFTGGGHRRSMRTLDGFLTGLAERLGKLPGGFVVTLPKIVSTEHVRVFTDFCARFEAEIGLPEGMLRFEVQVETPESVTALAGVAAAAGERLRGAHFGVHGYTAAIGLPPAEQRLDHPACDYARNVMQATFAGTGVRLSDGATDVVPAGEGTRDVHKAWRLHAGLVLYSLRNGFHQGCDMHPAQLPSRFATVYGCYLADLDEAVARVEAWQTQEKVTGGLLEEPATVRAVTDRLRRAVDCGAVDAAAVPSLR